MITTRRSMRRVGGRRGSALSGRVPGRGRVGVGGEKPGEPDQGRDEGREEHGHIRSPRSHGAQVTRAIPKPRGHILRAVDGPKAQVVGEARGEPHDEARTEAGGEPGGGARDEPGPPGAGRSWTRLLILLAGAAVALAAVTPVVVRWLGNPPDQRLVDLEVYRDGGRAVLRGAPLYDVLTQPPQLLPFTYPPFAAVLAVPFTLLPWFAAQVLWTVAHLRRAGRHGLLRLPRPHPPVRALGPARRRRAGRRDDLAHTRPGPVPLRPGRAVPPRDVPGGLLRPHRPLAARDARRPRRRDQAGAGRLPDLVPDHRAAGGAGQRGAHRRGRDPRRVRAAAVRLGRLLVRALLQGGDRTGAVDGTTNQAINGIVARILDEGPARTLVWLAAAAVVAYFGFRWSRRASLLADAVTGPDSRSLLLASVAIVGLLSVALSPVGWIHHLVWMIAVIAALAGDGRDTRRCLFAVALWVPFLFPIPWWARAMIGPDHSPASVFVGEALRDTFGAAALVSVLVLGVWLVKRVESDSITRILRDGRSGWVRSPRDACRGGRRRPGRGVAGLSIAVVADNRVNQVVGECGEMLRRSFRSPADRWTSALCATSPSSITTPSREMSGHRSFSLALINAVGDGVVVSSINGRTETRTYAKAIQGGHAVEMLSPEETRSCVRRAWARGPSCRWTTRSPTSATTTAPRPPTPDRPAPGRTLPAPDVRRPVPPVGGRRAAGGLHRAGSKLGIHTSHRAEARPAHPAHRQHPSGDP